jgi:hypothetical protein
MQRPASTRPSPCLRPGVKTSSTALFMPQQICWAVAAARGWCLAPRPIAPSSCGPATAGWAPTLSSRGSPLPPRGPGTGSPGRRTRPHQAR